MRFSNYDAALDDAIDRDLRDSERLAHFLKVITEALDAIARDVYPMEHPNARWHPGDLVDDLQGHIRSITSEQTRLRGPVTLEDE